MTTCPYLLPGKRRRVRCGRPVEVGLYCPFHARLIHRMLARLRVP